jgi:DivIVA domain-containing protein
VPVRVVWNEAGRTHGKNDVELPDLSAVDFTVVRKRGYSQQEVDRFLQVLDDELRRVESESRLLERRLDELENAPDRGAASGDEASKVVAESETPDAVVEAKERLLARARNAAAAILESAYRHAGVVDPAALPDDLDQEVRGEVAAMLARPAEVTQPRARGVDGEPEDRLAAAQLIAERLVRNAQTEAERVVIAARAEHLGLVARIARLQDLESQLAGAGSSSALPHSGRGVIVDLTGEEPVVAVADTVPDAIPGPDAQPERLDEDRPIVGSPSADETVTSTVLSDVGLLPPDSEHS